MPGPFNASSLNANGPSLGTFPITPNDNTDLVTNIRGVVIGTAGGTLSYVGWDGKTYTTGPLPVGGPYPICITRLRATGTTATGITGFI